MEKRPCPACGAPIADPSGACPSCGRKVPAPYDRDAEHLNLLSIFHYVLAALTALTACMPIIHIVMGLMMVFGEGFGSGSHQGPPPKAFGWLFVIMGSAFVIIGWVFAILIFAGGRSIARRRRYLFCQIAAGLSCLMVPLGTVLGVFTLVVLARPSVKPLFEAPPPVAS